MLKDLNSKTVKEIQFEEAWGKLEAKRLFRETTIDKIFEKNSRSHVKWRTTGYFFLDPKSFGNSFANSYIPRLLLIIRLYFNCGEKKIWYYTKKTQNIMSLSPKFCFAFYIFLTDPIVKNSNILAGIYFNFF